MTQMREGRGGDARVSSWQCVTYRMGSILEAGEVDHAINAGKGSASTTVSMRIKFLLGEDVATVLRMEELERGRRR